MTKKRKSPAKPKAKRKSTAHAALPQTMTAMEIRDRRLYACTRPVPKPARGEVLVRVAAAGVNRPDLLQRQGLYPPPAGVSDIPGLEISGTIVAIGTGVRGLKKGARVMALVAGGGYAEYCTVPAVQCLPVPKGLKDEMAAGIPETFFTVWTNLTEGARLKKGETLLVHGGASGIGTAAIQVAKKIIGAKVIVTAGTDDKCAACLKLGADKAVNYKTQEFVAEAKAFTGGSGVDAVLDMIGGDYLTRNLESLAPFGRHVSIAAQSGKLASVDISRIMQKRLILTGSTLRARSVAEKGAIAKDLKRKLLPLLAKKKIAPVIDKIFPLAEAQQALDYLESGRHIGKVVLKI